MVFFKVVQPLAADSIFRFGEMTSAIICGCLPALPRALAHFNSKISDAISSYRSSRAGKSKGSEVKILRALVAKSPSTSIDHSDGYLELTDQRSGQNNRQASPTLDHSADRLEPEPSPAYSNV